MIYKIIEIWISIYGFHFYDLRVANCEDIQNPIKKWLLCEDFYIFIT